MGEKVAAEELTDLLAKSVTCALLGDRRRPFSSSIFFSWYLSRIFPGNAGPQRSRILGLLYKDERVTSHLEPSQTAKGKNTHKEKERKKRVYRGVL